MTLLPEEEEAFAALVEQLIRPASRIPWAPVALTVMIVGEGVDGAALLGLDRHIAIAFWASFVLGLAVGLWCISHAGRRIPRSQYDR